MRNLPNRYLAGIALGRSVVWKIPWNTGQGPLPICVEKISEAVRVNELMNELLFYDIEKTKHIENIMMKII